MEKRIIFAVSSELTDVSVAMNDYKATSKTWSVSSGSDYLYIGARNPFNSFYIKFDNNMAVGDGAATVEYWDGTQWRSAIDVIDETADGDTFTNDGFITFSTDPDYGWFREDTNNGGDIITGISTFNILNLYWLRVNIGNVEANIPIKWIGTYFSTDTDLYGEYPIFNNSTLKTAYESGKTTWEEQAVIAADIIISDLMDRNVIKHSGQLLDRSRLKRASICKVAEIIFGALGDDYTDDMRKARNEYEKRLTSPILYVDQNLNANIDIEEEVVSHGWLSR